MKFPLSTGQVAEELRSSEPRLNGLIRRRKVAPPPPIVAGRRLWQREHLLQAASVFGVLSDELLERLDVQEAAHVS